MTAGFGRLAIGERLDFGRVMRGDERASVGRSIGVPFEIRTRREFAHALRRRELARRIEQGEVGRDRRRIERPVDTRDSPEGLQLGGEEPPLRRRGPIKRLHAGRITRQQELTFAREPSGESEDAVQFREAGSTVSGQQVGEHLGIAVTAEDDAIALQPDAEFAVVIDLAVEGDDDLTRRISHRLRSVG